MRASQRARACLGACFVLVLAAVGLGWQVSPASAATVTVRLSSGTPSPSAAKAVQGDSLVFSNADVVAHTVKAKSTNWTISLTVDASSSASYALKVAGTFTYTDTRQIFGTLNNGSVTVSATTRPPSPTAKPSATTKTSAAPKPTAQPSAVPLPSGSATPGSGTAVLPGLGTGQQTSPTPNQSTGPQPNLAPLPLGATPSGTPAASVSYDARGITQGSSHRYGLPAALAVVAITGMASLLVRLLLAEPAARRRRTRLDMTTQG